MNFRRPYRALPKPTKMGGPRGYETPLHTVVRTPPRHRLTVFLGSQQLEKVLQLIPRTHEICAVIRKQLGTLPTTRNKPPQRLDKTRRRQVGHQLQMNRLRGETNEYCHVRLHCCPSVPWSYVDRSKIVDTSCRKGFRWYDSWCW
uniref:(northern house mosquito) hypothetical protein n=1 Tax=Culex pipiens TaxID=7175 RepID=A0A8D8BN47_CULPI